MTSSPSFRASTNAPAARRLANEDRYKFMTHNLVVIQMSAVEDNLTNAIHYYKQGAVLADSTVEIAIFIALLPKRVTALLKTLSQCVTLQACHLNTTFNKCNSQLCRCCSAAYFKKLLTFLCLSCELLSAVKPFASRYFATSANEYSSSQAALSVPQKPCRHPRNRSSPLIATFFSASTVAFSDPPSIAGYKASLNDDWYSWQLFAKLAWIIMTHTVDGIVTQIRPDDIDENGQYVGQKTDKDSSSPLNGTTDSMLPVGMSAASNGCDLECYIRFCRILNSNPVTRRDPCLIILMTLHLTVIEIKRDRVLEAI
ncbi:hypothetical protein L596_010819 [Steinernema carpocapsae]|uniref:Uncharacterized protein n=1 Tax=Steinernema carpocapsae TaxID=34508 RepID=A0A4U5PLS8_STECR|nr:hypothetical protein L596_010819 [Steinernema carpocapsae]